jgi:hypothetical protein
LPPAKAELYYTLLLGTRQEGLILYTGIGTIGKTIIGTTGQLLAKRFEQW